MPIGFCGGAFCATNAVCLWDDRQQVSYCSCPEGFIGDGLQSCKSIPPKCNVRNNCGLNAQCLPVNDSYECVCNGGYYGDGLLCVPELNCRNVRELCHEFAQCIRTSAGYQCVCNTGKLIVVFTFSNIKTEFLLALFRIHRKRNSVSRTNKARGWVFVVESRCCHLKGSIRRKRWTSNRHFECKKQVLTLCQLIY